MTTTTTNDLRDLEAVEPIVDPLSGRASNYFLDYLFRRKGFLFGLVGDVEGKADASTQMIAGAGLTGGGTLEEDRTFDVGQGTGIIVGADDVAVDPEYIRDTIGTALVAGTNITITVDDPGNTITIAATSIGVIPVVDGSIPPIFIQNPDGSLVYTPV